MIIIAFISAYYFRMNLEAVPAFSDIGLNEYLRYSVYLMPIWITLFALNGLYYIRGTASTLNEIYRIFSASSTAMLFLVLTIFFSHTSFFSRLILIFTWALSIIAISMGRIIVKMVQRYLFKFGIGRRVVILVGDNNTSESVAYHIAKETRLGYKVAGVLDGGSETSKFGLKLLGSIDELSSKIKHYKADEVIVTETNIPKTKFMNMIQICSDNKITLKYIPDVFTLMTLNTSSELIGSMPVMEIKPVALDGWGRIVKRILDFTFAALLLITLSPLIFLISILIKLTSRGPVIYSHDRVGRDEQTFYCHKFRSMYFMAEQKERKYWTTENDSRVTPLGKILRKTNLDEIPQLWNILYGEMSFVGPRPEQPRFVEKFEKEIPDYFRRHKVKAGLTGWAQVNGLKGDTSIKDRVRYDMYYIENWTLWFDLNILLKTIGLIIKEAFGEKYEYRSHS